ncbi:MAG: phosphoenolpyruvate--protein phosphotransferase [Alphaproteobacteria bacterium]|nr:phosphoenolpyruvate--protein phosphotransferase [Alphaproteobacteria bacterium]
MDGDSVTATANWAGPRKLLRRLRDVMAGPGDAQERLDKIAKLIAADLVAEVCSIYVRRAGDVLELFATQGLKPEAVHNTRLRVGEGIVGAVAADSRPIALAEANKHPNFAYRPETGEEIYTSMMGVPILRGGRMLGVLAVQNRTKRHYTDEEVETLETVSMVVAEMVVGGELIGAAEQNPADGIGLKPLRLEGIRLNGGLALGRAVLHRPEIPVGRTVAEDAEEEKHRLETALDSMHRRLDDMLAAADADGPGDHIDILKTYRMFAKDKGWIRRIVENIDNGLTAEGAVVRVQDDTRARMKKVDDAYLRERLLDLEDLAFRLLQHLSGETGANKNLPEDTILIARNLGPADLLDYDRAHLRALILEEGSSTSHVAIVAKALQIPVVGRVKNILDRVEPMDTILVDGGNALCYIRPGDEVLSAFQYSMRMFEEKRAAYLAAKDLPSITRDGVEISLMMNAGLLIDMVHLHATGAKGIGLYRTEVPFMVRSDFPDTATQADLYSKIMDQAEGKPITFRTLDIGGDKVLPYFQEAEEENPAMGWRAIRIAIDRPGLLRGQLRALIQASAGRPLRVMFPMIANTDEFVQARAMLDKELGRAAQRGMTLPERIEIGAMLEVPSLIYQLDTLGPKADFVSVGSNDLLQFLFASDRGNPRLDGRYDSLSAPVLNVMRDIVRRSDAAGLELSVCGEMAGNPLDALALIGLGIRRLSMSPGNIGPVRDAVRGADSQRLADFTDTLTRRTDRSLRQAMADFARDHGIPV